MKHDFDEQNAEDRGIRARLIVPPIEVQLIQPVRSVQKRLRDRDEDDEIIIIKSMISSQNTRMPHIFRKRWDSDYLINLAEQEGTFLKEYRFDPQGFSDLHEMLYQYLDVDNRMSELSRKDSKSGPITVASRLGTGLILLSGGRPMEAMRTHGISRSQVYLNFHRFLDAIIACPALDITYDGSLPALQKRAAKFAGHCQHNLFQFVTDGIDGLSIPIHTPKARQGDGTVIANTNRFYDGSKKNPAISLQVVVDAYLNVTAFTAKHVGSTHDNDAFETSSLKDLCSGLRDKFPYHWLGDSAYNVSQTMMVPYPGINLDRSNPDKNAFNYYHSQLRIICERFNAVYIRTWGIFWTSLEHDVKTIFKIVHATMRLHIFRNKEMLL